jgi:hypothetical protein
LQAAKPEDLTDKLNQLREEFRQATLDFVAGYTPLRDAAMEAWREAAQDLNGSAERLIATIEQSFPPAGEIAKRFAFETRLISTPHLTPFTIVPGGSRGIRAVAGGKAFGGLDEAIIKISFHAIVIRAPAGRLESPVFPSGGLQQ